MPSTFTQSFFWRKAERKLSSRLKNEMLPPADPARQVGLMVNLSPRLSMSEFQAVFENAR